MKNLTDYVELCKLILDDCGIPYDKSATVTVNHRLRSVYGRCKTAYRYGEIVKHEIDLNDVLLHDDVSDKSLEDTILHEFLHTCKGCDNHGNLWKHYAAIINTKYGYDLQRCGGDKDDSAIAAMREKRQAVEPYKYKVYCPVCGATWHYKRKTRVVEYPHRYLCGNCKTNLESDYISNGELAYVANA